MTEVYALVRESVATPGTILARVALMPPSLREVSYRTRARIGCDQATLRASRVGDAEAEILARIANLGEIAIFAHDPTSPGVTHPFEPSPSVATTTFVRVWDGRISEIERNPGTGEVTVEAFGWGRGLADRIVTETYTSKRIFEIVQDLFNDHIGAGFLPALALSSDIQTTGRCALRLDEIDFEGVSVEEALTRLADLAGSRVDFGIDRDRVFFFRFRSNPFHQSAGFLPSFGTETGLDGVELRRSLAGTVTVVKVYGARPSPGSPRPSVTVESSLGTARFGYRAFELVRDDIGTYGTLLLVAMSELRKRNAIAGRVRATIHADLYHALDRRVLPAIVLREERRVPRSYASASTTAPSGPMGFSIRLTRANSNAILVPIVDTADVPDPWHFEIVRKLRSTPSSGQTYTIAVAVRTPAQGGGFAFRLYQFNNAGSQRIRVDWNGSGTPIDFAVGDVLNTTVAWGLSFHRNGSNEIILWKDGTSVATATVTGQWILHGASGVLVGENESLANADDANVQDFALWSTYRTTTNFLSKIGTHAKAITRALGATMRFWVPCWEGQGTAPTVKSGIAPSSTASAMMFGSPAPTWEAGLITGAGGGRLPGPQLDAQWNAGNLFAGSPIVQVEEIARRWAGPAGWVTEIEGGLLSPTIGRPIEEIDERLRRLETGDRVGTGSVPSVAV